VLRLAGRLAGRADSLSAASQRVAMDGRLPGQLGRRRHKSAPGLSGEEPRASQLAHRTVLSVQRAAPLEGTLRGPRLPNSTGRRWRAPRCASVGLGWAGRAGRGASPDSPASPRRQASGRARRADGEPLPPLPPRSLRIDPGGSACPPGPPSCLVWLETGCRRPRVEMVEAWLLRTIWREMTSEANSGSTGMRPKPPLTHSEHAAGRRTGLGLLSSTRLTVCGRGDSILEGLGPERD